MPDRFTGTMLTKINTQGGLPEDPAKAFSKMSEETDKALLDILKKVNELAGTSADASATGSTLSGLGGALSSAIKGMKYGLDVIYVSSDTLSILPGAVEVNGELVVCPNALAITPSLPNFPAAGSWAFVTIEKGGTHRLFPATGAGTVRPSDNCFQLTGGGVGFDDIGKQGYYYDPARRIIGAIHMVNATTWYLIRLGAGIIESGSNAYGSYRKFSDGTLEQWGVNYNSDVMTSATPAVGYFILSLGYFLPTSFIDTNYIITGNAGMGELNYPQLAYFVRRSVSVFGVTLWCNYPYGERYIQWHVIGRWK